MRKSGFEPATSRESRPRRLSEMVVKVLTSVRSIQYLGKTSNKTSKTQSKQILKNNYQNDLYIYIIILMRYKADLALNFV